MNMMLLLVDSTEPVGPAVQLFTKGFYAGIAKALKNRWSICCTNG